MRHGGASLKISGLGLVSFLIAVLGLVAAAVGLVLGVYYGHPVGGMVGLTIGAATIVVALIMKDD